MPDGAFADLTYVFDDADVLTSKTHYCDSGALCTLLDMDCWNDAHIDTVRFTDSLPAVNGQFPLDPDGNRSVPYVRFYCHVPGSSGGS